MAGLVWLNGALVRRDDARVSVDDLGFLYGAACFETMRASGGVVFRLARHLDRLERGLEGLGVTLPARAVLEEALVATLAANALEDARLRLTVSAGTGSGRPDLAAAVTPTVLVAAEPLPAPPPPARALVAREVRVDPARPLSFAKTANYLPALLALAEARRSGFDQALLLDPADRLVEAATANLFLVIDGGLVTPPLEAGPLPGITREAVLDCAREQGIAVEERPVPLAALRDASEGFLTNSVAGVQPLAEVRFGPDSWRGEAPGPTTASLASGYDALLLRERRQSPPDGLQHES